MGELPEERECELPRELTQQPGLLQVPCDTALQASLFHVPLTEYKVLCYS